MQIEVNKEYGYKFCQYLIFRLKSWFYLNTDFKKLIVMLNFALVIFNREYKNQKLSTERFINFLFKNLNIVTFEEYYLITFDETVIVSEFNEKLFTIIQFIDNGNLEIAPYPIFSEMFDYANSNLSKIYQEFKGGF